MTAPAHLMPARWWTPNGRPPVLAVPPGLLSDEEWAALDRAEETIAAAEEHWRAVEVARSGRPDPRLGGTVFEVREEVDYRADGTAVLAEEDR